MNMSHIGPCNRSNWFHLFHDFNERFVPSGSFITLFCGENWMYNDTGLVDVQISSLQMLK